MSKKDVDIWIVTSAWPTINNIPHLGTILHLLSADVISRFLRILGKEVISVSGSDIHGTPVLLRAGEEGVEPKAYAELVHNKVVELLQAWNIKLDNYTITNSPHHTTFIQDYYQHLKDNKTIFLHSELQFYCPECDLFLPDRFIEGTCPYCQDPQSRGDQCSNSNCNQILTPKLLINPKCKQCHSIPVEKETTHYYLDLEILGPKIKTFIKSSNSFSPIVINEALKFFEDGLKSRAVTRDLSWGIDATYLFDQNEKKVFYVWAEDVLGYVSASKEVIEKKDPNTNWKAIWSSPKTRTVYCLGLDNIFFHAIWLPALLLASNEQFILPHFLSTTQFLQFNGEAFSKSKNIGVWIDEALKIAEPDLWRFYLIYNRPEKKSFNFEWVNFVEIINNELIANIINLVHRTCSLIWKYNNGIILLPVKITNTNNLKFTAKIQYYVEDIIQKIEYIQIKDALHQIVDVSKAINGHLSRQEPWKKKIVSDRFEDIFFTYALVSLTIHLLEPVIPTLATKLKIRLGTNNIRIDLHSFNIAIWIKDYKVLQKLPALEKIIAPLEIDSLIKQYHTLKKT